jgi:hypothetical protein
MTENVNVNAPAPAEGVGEQQTPEVRQPDGSKRFAHPTEARLYREALEKAKAKPAGEKQVEGEKPGGEETQDQQRDQQPEPGAEGLELEIPIEVPREHFEQTEANIAEVSSIAKEIGMPREDAQGLVDYAVALAVSDQSGVNIEDQDACMVVLQNRYGKDAAETIVGEARRAVHRLGAKAEKFLIESQLGNSPAVVAALAAWDRGDLRMSQAKAQAALAEMQKDPRGAYRNASHSGHKAAVDRASLLYQIIGKAEAKADAKRSAEPKPTKPAANAQRASLERELKAAIAAPEYRKSGPGHAEAVARVEKLYRDMYPGNHRADDGNDEE